jgi:hypothetical protein
MANRTVSVELQLKAAGFVSGAKEAEKATSSLNTELHEVGEHDREFADAVRDAEVLAVAVKEASHETDKLGDQSRETAADAHFLATELAKTRREVEELTLAYALLGRADDQAALKQKTSRLRDLEATSKQLSEQVAKSLAQGGEDGVQAVASSVEGGASSGGAIVGSIAMWGPLLAPVVAVVGAGLGGVLGGAIVAGIGTVSIGAGVLAAFQRPEVKAAAGPIKAEFAAIVGDVGAEFAGPTITGLHLLAAELDHLRPGLRATAAELAPLTADVFAGITEGVDKFAGHMERALINGKPLIEWAGHEIPVVLDEVGGLLENLSEHADEERFALNLFFGVVQMGIKVIEGLADVGSAVLYPFEKLHDLVLGAPKGSTFADAGRNAAAAVLELGHATSVTNPTLDDLEKQLHSTALTMDKFTEDATTKVLDALVGMDRATLGVAESQTRLSDSIKTNKLQLDIHSAAGQANRESVLGVVSANVQMYKTMLESGASADEAAKSYDANTASLEKQLKKAGFTKGQIDDLIGSYRNVPKNVDTTLAMNGLADAINDLDDLIRMLNGLPLRKTITITTHHVTTGVAVGVTGARAQGGQLPHAAEGAFFGPSDPGILIAEPSTHGEWMIPQAGISQQRAYDLGAAAMAPHGLSVGRPAMVGMGGGPQSLQLAATFVLPSGEVVHKQLITYALNTGRQPAQLFPAVSR